MQLDQAHKGFSFSKEAPLDMRMDPTLELSAQDIVNTWSEEELGELFRELGEEPRWKKAAAAIVHGRRRKKIHTTTELSSLIVGALKTPLRGKWHPATLVFQALRMCVNRELEVISEGISKAIDFLAPEGRVGVMSFHRLEDRIVKNLFREAAAVPKHLRKQRPPFRIITKKPLVPSYQEVRANPRARSAKMRFLEKT